MAYGIESWVQVLIPLKTHLVMELMRVMSVKAPSLHVDKVLTFKECGTSSAVVLIIWLMLKITSATKDPPCRGAYEYQSAMAQNPSVGLVW
ncbi:hypothetical protein TNCV_4661651 [Trichonephila clavipes]|uniref:Uncharacterized protein n=1 Tax=Trichonephila clavipes TaxID=2585209 RepID=A0A8X6VDU7_TRICX|nr:hypothetical protein TNCV_4661651 [Trichonephila clavipes]